MLRFKVFSRCAGRRPAVLGVACAATISALVGGLVSPAGAALTPDGSGHETHVYATPPSGGGGNGGTQEGCIQYGQSVIDVVLLTAATGTVGSSGTVSPTSPVALSLTINTVTNQRWEGPSGTYDITTGFVAGSGALGSVTGGCVVANKGAVIPADTTSSLIARQGATNICATSSSVTSIARVGSPQVRTIVFKCNGTTYTLTATGIPSPPTDPPCTPAALSISCPEAEVTIA